jgi:hypothetical protein
MRKNLFLASALALLGCGDRNFNTPQLLNVPRVLAIQAEPPQPRVGTATTLQALVYVPPGDPGETATYSWKWCPLPTTSNNNYKCSIEQTGFDQLYASLGLGVAPSFDLGTGKTTTLVNPFPAFVLAGLCNNAFSLFPGADAGAPTSSEADSGQANSICQANGLFGYPITIYLSVGPTSLGNLDAVYTVNLPTDDTVPGNLNPIVGGIQATWKGAPDAGTTAVDTQLYDASPPEIDAGEPAIDAGEPAIDAGEAAIDAGEAVPSSPTDTAGVCVNPSSSNADVLLDDAFSTTVPRDKRIQLHLQLPCESSEVLPPSQADAIYAAAQDPTLTKRLTERLDAYWFTEAGGFGGEGGEGSPTGFLGFPDDIDSPFSGATDNKWTLPIREDYKGDTARLIVVVRDSRGGVTWTTGSASLEPKP